MTIAELIDYIQAKTSGSTPASATQRWLESIAESDESITVQQDPDGRPIIVLK